MRFRTASVLFAVVLLSACVTVPSNRSVRVCPDADSKLGRINRVAVVADSCLYRDVLGDGDYWSVQESQLTQRYMAEAAKKCLITKGYEVTFVQTPFVGSFKKRDAPFRFATEVGGEVKEKNPPLHEAEELAQKPAYREALMKVIPGALGSRTSGLPDACCSKGELKDHMDVIADHTGGDATLFLIGHGVIVSAGKQLTQGIGTGLLTAALTLGTISVSRYNLSWMDTYAIFVDNATGEILWSNAIRLKGDGFTGEGYYAERWPAQALYHLPSKMNLSVPQAPEKEEN